MKCQTISPKYFFAAKGAIYYVAIATAGALFTFENNVIFSRVKISCFRRKAHRVLHWCL